MPKILALYCLIFLVVACQKEEIQPVPSGNSDNPYSNTGDVLLLVFNDSSVTAYEYNVPSAINYRDSLPLMYSSSTYIAPNQNYHHLHFGTSSDTLFTVAPNNYNLEPIVYHAPQTPDNHLDNSFLHLPFVRENFIVEAPSLHNFLPTFWNQVSDLAVVHAYRNSAKSKIHALRTIVMQFDEELGFSTPTLKPMLVLSRW